VFSAELNCWPGDFLAKYPTGSKRYVNSGGYIGYKHAIMKWFTWQSLEFIQTACKDFSDQGYAHMYYLTGPKGVVLDTKSRIFWSMYFVAWRDVEFLYGRAYNTTLQQTPCFMHFNGNSWQTKDDVNIMPICNTFVRTSADSDVPLSLAAYAAKHPARSQI